MVPRLRRSITVTFPIADLHCRKFPRFMAESIIWFATSAVVAGRRLRTNAAARHCICRLHKNCSYFSTCAFIRVPTSWPTRARSWVQQHHLVLPVENVPPLCEWSPTTGWGRRAKSGADASTFGPSIVNLNNRRSKLVSDGCSLVLSIVRPKSLMHGRVSPSVKRLIQ